MKNHGGHPDKSVLFLSFYKFSMAFWQVHISCLSWGERAFTTTPVENLMAHPVEYSEGVLRWMKAVTAERDGHQTKLCTQAFWKLQNDQEFRMFTEWWSQDGVFLPTPWYHPPLHFCPYIQSTPMLIHCDLSTPESQHMVAKQSGEASFSVLPRKNTFHDNLSFSFRTGSVT